MSARHAYLVRVADNIPPEDTRVADTLRMIKGVVRVEEAPEVDEQAEDIRRQRDTAEQQLARVRQYCELTADSCHVPTRQTAIDVLQLLDEPGVEPG